MGYSKEFMDWTGNVIEPSFEIREVSAGLKDGEYNDVACDGLHFIGMYKRKSDSMLMLKMKSSNEDGYQYQTYLDVKRIYAPNNPTPLD